MTLRPLPTHFQMIRDHYMVGKRVQWIDLVKVKGSHGIDYQRILNTGKILTIDTTGQCALVAHDDGSIRDLDVCDIDQI